MAKNIALAAGWVLAIVLGGVLFVELQTVGAMKNKLAAAEEAVTAARDAAARMVDLESKCAALEVTVAKLEAASKKGIGAAAAVRDSVEVPENFDPSALLKNMLGGEKAGAGDKGGDKKSKNPFSAMFEGEKGEQMLEAMLPAQVDMQYSALLAELNLSDERKAALRDILIEHARKGARVGMAMMRGEKSPEDTAIPSKDDLLAAVGELLDPEEMKQFTEYQETLPERLLRQQYDMQVGMFAGDLPQEVRDRTVDVLVENILASQPNATESGSMPNFDAMRSAFDNSLATLEQEVAPEYLDRVRAVIQQQRMGIDMAASMLSNDDKPEESTAGQ